MISIEKATSIGVGIISNDPTGHEGRVPFSWTHSPVGLDPFTSGSRGRVLTIRDYGVTIREHGVMTA